MFERTRRKDVSTHDRPDGWFLGTKATHEKFIQLHNEASGSPQTDDEVVDTIMNASNRSDCRPGAGHGPKARSSSHPCSKQHMREQLVASQRKNERLEENVKMLMESHAKLIEDMAHIKTLLDRRSHDTSSNVVGK